MNIKMIATIITLLGILGLMVFKFALRQSIEPDRKTSVEREHQKKMQIEERQNELLKMGITKEMLNVDEAADYKERISPKAKEDILSHDPEVLKQIIAVQTDYITAVGRLSFSISYPDDKERQAETYACSLTVQVPDKYRIVFKKDDQVDSYISNGEIEWHLENIGGYPVASKKDLDLATGKFSGVSEFIPLRLESLQKEFILCASSISPKSTNKNLSYELLLLPRSKDRSDHMQWIRLYFNKECLIQHIKMQDGKNNRYDFEIQSMDYNTVISVDKFIHVEED